MYVQPINNRNINFEGSYRLKGPWTEKMKEVAVPFLEKLAEGDKEVIAQMKTKRALDRYHRFGQKLYKLTLSSRDENRSFLGKIKDKFLSANRVDVTEHFHSRGSTEDVLAKRLDLSKYNIRSYCILLDINNL